MRYSTTTRELREGVGWSQSELARRAGIERTRLNRCETGSERLKPEEEGAVCQALRQAAEETEQRAAQVRTKLAAGVSLVSVKQGVGTGRKSQPFPTVTPMTRHLGK